MISFTKKSLFAKGTCMVQLSNTTTGEIMYSGNKFQTSNIQSSVSLGEIRGGLGSGVVAIIPAESSLTVDFAAADFDLRAKAMQTGATFQMGAPAPTCEVLTADTETLTLAMPNGAPVAQIGYNKIFGYVQIVGQESKMAVDGVPYEINPSTGEVKGFQATSGTQYKVWYFVQKASAELATISTSMAGAVCHFTAQIAVYSNESGQGSNNTGSRVGWLYVIIPRLKFDGTGGGLEGDQTTAIQTQLRGTALASDDGVVSATCADCADNIFGHYLYVPDQDTGVFTGLAVVGGVVSVPVSESAQIPVKLVAGNGELVTPGSYSDGFTYTPTGAPTGTQISDAGVVQAGSTPGDFRVKIEYQDGTETLTATIQVSVTSAG